MKKSKECLSKNTQIVIQLPCQSSFRILTNSTNLINLLKMWYGKYCVLFDGDIQNLNCKEILVLQYDQEYKIEWNGITSSTSNPLLAIHRIVFQSTEYENGFIAFHGGAVEWHKKAYAFLAPTTAGKTTLTSFLCSCGFGYMTDDCILLNADTYEIYPFLTPVRLRKEGFSVLKKYDSQPMNYDIINEPSMERILYTPETCVKEPIPLERIFFIKRTDDLCFCKDMNANDILINLLKSPIREYPLTREYIHTLSSLSKVNCYKLHYSDMRYVEHILKYN